MVAKQRQTTGCSTAHVEVSLLAPLESAYSLILGAHQIWGQGRVDLVPLL